MAFFENLKERASGLAQSGVAKSKELAEIGKLKLDNADEENTIRKAYVEIGKLYYAERGMTPDAAYAAQCEKITAAQANIEKNNARIAEIRADDDTISDADVAEPEAEVEVEAEPENKDE